MGSSTSPSWSDEWGIKAPSGLSDVRPMSYKFQAGCCTIGNAECEVACSAAKAVGGTVRGF